jgi:hypothetical protein
MLIVSSQGSTTITATLQQQAQNKVNPYFTWYLYHKGTNKTITFTANDISTSPNYWNQYIITVATASVGLTNGVIPLTVGEYHYHVYEMINPYDLNINNSIGEVENGIMVVGLTFSVASSAMADNSVSSNPIPVSTLI